MDYRTMADDEIKAALRQIVETSTSDAQIKERVIRELGYPHEIMIDSCPPRLQGPGGLTRQDGAAVRLVIEGPRDIISMPSYEEMTVEEVKWWIVEIVARYNDNDMIEACVSRELGYSRGMIFVVASDSSTPEGIIVVTMARQQHKPVRSDGVSLIIRMEGPDGEPLMI